MSDEPLFATLTDVALRDAWTHEAHRFTPWLAANLDRLADVIGMPLELTGTEMRVGTFSADILARNAADDSVVLIENQLEGSDHTHLGQIMTYLAGLEAQTMIWVAPSFRDEHLSAIRWLNEHTVDPFAFFAVRIRVVRIADSPFAPLFEVIERPNNWDRQVSEKKRATEGDRSELGKHRLAFWTHFCTRYPDQGTPGAASSRWAALPGTDLLLVQYLSRNGVGVFVRPPRGGSDEELEVAVRPHFDTLVSELNAKLEIALGSRFDTDPHDVANWDRMADWLDQQTKAYQAAFARLRSQSATSKWEVEP
ncbi:MAG: DUF4268 domain-containing protein [Sphingomonas sp.]|uniref:hypothetical protein n=1 Tax=Sphingomonas sp. TaxID=28214 RepID=UPI0025F72459|nr:hypothetical protein [Sphingomonas sp.]MBY0282810.1 DUF4268 domain-containing protein [Sphingomonas sp.]